MAAILGNEQDAISAAARMQHAAASGDLAGFQTAFVSFTASGQSADKAAIAYGATACSK
jgi:hypothetical protein